MNHLKLTPIAALIAMTVSVFALSTNLHGQRTTAGSGDDGGLAGAGIPLMTTTRVASGLVRPIYVTHAPGDPTRLYIIEKQGRIRILKIDTAPPTLLATAFLDIDPIITGGTSNNSEQGLLGLAFHPDYQTNGYFYVNYTAVSPANATVIASYRRSAGNPDLADTASETRLLTFSQPQTNHNGGWIDFGPDGYLYVATGDGGNFNDIGTGHTEPGGNAQDLNNLLGNILRIDIDGADNIPGNDDDDGIIGNGLVGYTSPSTNPYFGAIPGRDEIYAHGLRNPWRCSFDRGTGDFYIADVGQGQWEEVNVNVGNLPGKNYGWRCYEGNAVFNFDSVCVAVGAANMTFPVHVYDHSSHCSITGGYVYRGAAMPLLHGTYFFADFCSNNIWSFKFNGTTATNLVNRTSELAPGGGLSILSITSFGEDLTGEIYICDQSGGEVFKIIPRPCTGDVVPDGTVNVSDLLAVIGAWGPCPPPCPADIDGSGTVNVSDLLAVIGAWGTCP